MKSTVGAPRTVRGSATVDTMKRKRRVAAAPPAPTTPRTIDSSLAPPFEVSAAERLCEINSDLSRFVLLIGGRLLPERPYRDPAVRRPMEYPTGVRRLLDGARADIGDTVAVTARGDRLEGVVMPHHAFSGTDILTLKLGSGYNVGIDVKDATKVELLAKHVPAAKKAVVVPRSGKLPVLSVLGTGGTIASYVDYRTGAVHPAVTAEELVSTVPELMELADVKARVVYSVLSEDMKPANWQHLAGE